MPRLDVSIGNDITISAVKTTKSCSLTFEIATEWYYKGRDWRTPAHLRERRTWTATNHSHPSLEVSMPHFFSVDSPSGIWFSSSCTRKIKYKASIT